MFVYFNVNCIDRIYIYNTIAIVPSSLMFAFLLYKWILSRKRLQLRQYPMLNVISFLVKFFFSENLRARTSKGDNQKIGLFSRQYILFWSENKESEVSFYFRFLRPRSWHRNFVESEYISIFPRKCSVDYINQSIYQVETK